MPDIDSSEIKNELSLKLKNVKKLIKYLEGIDNVPSAHQRRINKNIEHLISKLNIDNLNELYQLKTDLIKGIEKLNERSKNISYLEHIRGWYLRPLLSHFDNALKMQTFISPSEGIDALEKRLHLYIPKPYFNLDHEIIKSNINQFFKFKAFGKGSEASTKLENNFYDRFIFNEINPWQDTTLGSLGLPVIHYKVQDFFRKLKSNEPSVLVTGLCPLSTISDEIGLMLSENKIVRSKLGFEPLQVKYDDVIDIAWPPKPIISDYIKIKNILELYKITREKFDVSAVIWYPYHEYYLDITENIFVNYIESELLSYNKVRKGLDRIKERYFKLIEKVRLDLDLVDEKDILKIEIIEIDEDKYNKLEEFRKCVDLSFFKYIYGSWVGNKLRRTLYEQLVVKHIRPVLDGYNVLHLDTSYELWVDMLGAIVLENQRPDSNGNFSWINYPSIPSIRMSHMREYNAAYDDKLYLGDEENSFKKLIERLPKKYLLHLAPLVLGKRNIENKKDEIIINELKSRISEINSFF